MKRVCRIVWSLLVVCSLFMGTLFAMQFRSEFADPLLTEGWPWDERAFNIDIDDEAWLLDNLKKVFYPDSSGEWWWGAIWRAVRTISIWVFIVLLIRAGTRFLLYSQDEAELKKSWLNLIYIIYGFWLVILVVWVLWSALSIWSITGLEGDAWSLLPRAENNVILFILTGLKTAAFFLAIIFLSYYGYQMVAAFDQEDKVTAAKKWFINVIIALIFIRIIDYLYFIAQEQTFISDGIQFIIFASRALWYFGGIAIVFMLIYAGYMMVTSTWNEENMKKATSALRATFIVVILLLLFLLIIYQVFQDLLGTA